MRKPSQKLAERKRIASHKANRAPGRTRQVYQKLIREAQFKAWDKKKFVNHFAGIAEAAIDVERAERILSGGDIPVYAK
jgi:hypothetical protein